MRDDPPPKHESRLKRFGNAVLDLLYPSRCGVCEAPLPGTLSLCDTCETSLLPLPPPFCQCCGEPFPGAIDSGFSCPNCSMLDFAFDFARPAMALDPQLRELIHQLKYGRELHLAPTLAGLAVKALDDPRFHEALAEKWPLVPVPLHRTRLRLRHFNQAEEIGKCLGKLTSLPTLKALKRIRATETQTALTRSQRLKNLSGAFQVSLAGKRALRRNPQTGVILIDDVLTTGSTVHACAKALRVAGFRKIAVITVMRG